MKKISEHALPADAPAPHAMPVNADEYARKISLCHFINAYYQVRDILTYSPKRTLIIGVGVGLEPLVLRSKFGIEVTTLDIDARFNPDLVGSVHDLAMCRDKEFDVVVASHVLEHLPFAYFDRCVDELARVSHHAIIYLPYGGRHLEWKFTYAQRVREYAVRLNIPPLMRVRGDKPELQAGHHYWECGYPGFSVDTITQRLSRCFSIDQRYHNHDWSYSLNFLLTARDKR